ncbi:MAG: 50S ribosomal protein L23 [archaeon]|jgi:ribosomal protein uL23|nr:50S ribosomal protein L23 [archaeon]
MNKELEIYEIILFPLITEKAVNMIETENKLCFVVNEKANKAKVKEAVEKNYSVEVDNVNILNDRKGRKKAIVKINEKFKADELATKLGVL